MVFITADLKFFTGNIHGPQVSQHQMVVRTAGDQVKALFQQRFCHGLCVPDHIMGIGFKLRLHGFPQADCLCCDHMLERAALGAGEHSGVQLFGIRFTGQDQAAPRATEGLMGGGCDNIRIGHRTHMGAARNQTGNVGHVHHQHCTNLMGNVRKNLKIDGSGIGGRTGNHKLGLAFLCHVPDLVIVDQAGIMVDIIGNHIVILAGHIGRAAMGQVSAVGQTHAHHGITGLQQSQLNRHIGLSARMGLDIGKFRAKQRFCPVNAKLLDLIHHMTAAIVALAGQALGIFVGENGTHGSDDRRRREVLRRNQLQAVALPVELPVHHGSQLRIIVGNKSNGIDGFCQHSQLPLYHFLQNKKAQPQKDCSALRSHVLCPFA